MEQNKIILWTLYTILCSLCLFVNLFLNAISATKLDSLLFFVIVSNNIDFSSSELSSLDVMDCNSKLIILNKDTESCRSTSYRN
jgi:hypothetical protein